MFANFDETYIKELSQLLAKDFSREDWLAKVGRMSTGVITGDKVGLIPQGSFKNVVAASCNPTYTSINNPAKTTWTVKDFGIYKELCYDNVLAELKRNQKLYNLADNEAVRVTMLEFVEKAMVESVVAHAFLGNSDASENVTTGLGDIDGVFAQAINAVAGGTADATQVYAIPTNSKAYGKTGTNAIEILENLIDAAPAAVKGSDKAIIICTQALYDCVRYDLTVNKGFYIQDQLNMLFGGMRETTYNGYRLVVMPELDNIIGQLQSGDQFYNKPLLALFTTSDNLAFGSSSDEEAGIKSVELWNDPRTKTTLVSAVYSLGAILVDPKGFSIAY